jgi:hypothetical protein
MARGTLRSRTPAIADLMVGAAPISEGGRVGYHACAGVMCGAHSGDGACTGCGKGVARRDARGLKCRRRSVNVSGGTLHTT